MADIFISYNHEDEARVIDLVHALEEKGWSIFWDRRIPAGKTWQSYIGQALSDAKCVIVAWSRHSITSKWVIEEANDAEERGLLIPVLLDSVKPPLGFRGIQAADLTDWKLGYSSPSFDQLIQDIAVIAGGEPHRSTPEEALTPRTQPATPLREVPTEPPPLEAPHRETPHRETPSPKPEPSEVRLRKSEAIEPNSAEPGIKWTPRDIRAMIGITMACLCLLVLVLGLIICAFMGKLSSELLGSIKGIGVGGGFLSLALILSYVIKMCLFGPSNQRGASASGN